MIFIGLDVAHPIQYPPMDLEKLRPDTFAAPALQGRLADTPAFGQLGLIEMTDFHLVSLLCFSVEVHDGAVRPESQRTAGIGHGFDCEIGIELAGTSEWLRS